jgi:hypothetical protein
MQTQTTTQPNAASDYNNACAQRQQPSYSNDELLVKMQKNLYCDVITANRIINNRFNLASLKERLCYIAYLAATGQDTSNITFTSICGYEHYDVNHKGQLVEIKIRDAKVYSLIQQSIDPFFIIERAKYNHLKHDANSLYVNFFAGHHEDKAIPTFFWNLDKLRDKQSFVKEMNATTVVNGGKSDKQIIGLYADEADNIVHFSPNKFLRTIGSLANYENVMINIFFLYQKYADNPEKRNKLMDFVKWLAV